MSKKNTIFIVTAVFQEKPGIGLPRCVFYPIKMPKDADGIDACSAFKEYYNNYLLSDKEECVSCEAFKMIDGTKYYE
jgi:hypothetical protein